MLRHDGTPDPTVELSSSINDVPRSGTEHSHSHSLNEKDEKDDCNVRVCGWDGDFTVTGLVVVIL